jgi:hypothetical protein
VFDHTGQGQLLYFKERFLGPEDPEHDLMVLRSQDFKRLGISDSQFMGPPLSELKALLRRNRRTDLLDEVSIQQDEPY